MKLLVDTHVVAWMAIAPQRVGRKTHALLDRALPRGDGAISALTLFEFSKLTELGSFRLHRSLDELRADFRHAGYVELPTTGDVALAAAALPGFHGDPFDRLIVATALVEGRTLVTAHSRILDWPGRLSRHDATN